MKYRDPNTGNFKEIFVKALDNLPIGSIIDYDGTEVPEGWEQVGNSINAITARLNANTDITVASAYTPVIVNLTHITYNLGEAFTLITDTSNVNYGKIRINKAGYYKISACATLTSLNNANTHLILSVLGGTSYIMQGYNRATGIGYVNISLAPRLVYLNEGGIISLGVSSNTDSDNVRLVGNNYTYLTIESVI